MLERAEVGETPADDGVVEPGHEGHLQVRGRLTTTTPRRSCSAPARWRTPPAGLKVYSPQSPLGSAITGAKKGDTVAYEAPNGKELKVVIVDAVPYTG